MLCLVTLSIVVSHCKSISILFRIKIILFILQQISYDFLNWCCIAAKNMLELKRKGEYFQTFKRSLLFLHTLILVCSMMPLCWYASKEGIIYKKVD